MNRILLFTLFILSATCALMAQSKNEAENIPINEDCSYNGFDISQSSLNDELTVLSFDYKKTKEWKRYKLLRGLGIGAVTVGILGTWLSAEFCALSSSYEGTLPAGIVSLSIMGSVLLSSIPLFIYAGKYKKKALALNVGVSALAVPSMQGFHTSPGLTLAFSF
ncbi:MAG: hypothetical protein HDT06_08125 [Bacteroidales bacterium]|nr:hypothetical protein [Bacteroidales bacterium]